MIVYVQLEVATPAQRKPPPGDRSYTCLTHTYDQRHDRWLFRVVFPPRDKMRGRSLDPDLLKQRPETNRLLFYADEFDWAAVVHAAANPPEPYLKHRVYDWVLRPW